MSMWPKLSSRAYRDAYVKSRIVIGLSFRLRSILNARGIRQQGLVDSRGSVQSLVSRVISQDSTPSLSTLIRIANALDCGLRVEFVPFSELVELDFDPNTHSVVPFTEDTDPNAQGASNEQGDGKGDQ
jgi:transcriptional regulator with XRE-family HTH domain